MTDARQKVGAVGEQAAVDYLRRRGFEVLERNARTRYGELDIVAVEGRALVFAEVKALRGNGRERAEQALESIGARKRLQVRRLARAWLAERAPPTRCAEMRFDAIGVAVSGASADIVHVPAAF